MASYQKWVDIEELELNKILALPYTNVVEVLIEVGYNKSKHYPATLETPEEPSEIEITEVEVIDVRDGKGNYLKTSVSQDKRMLKDLTDNAKYLEYSLELWAWEEEETNEYY